MEKIKKYKYKIFLVFFVIGLIISLILTFANQNQLCSNSRCNLVLSSKYASLLGVKNSFYGAIIFAALSIITFFQIRKPSKNKENLIKYSLIASSLISLYFLYLQQFILKAYCPYCLIVNISNLINLIILILACQTWKR